MAKHVFSSALFAGLGAGILATLLQLVFIVPTLVEAELYESGSKTHFSEGVAQSPAGVPDIMGEMTRHLGTFGSNLVTYVGFALILVALFMAADRMGREIDARTGAIWGLCGFIAVNLAPAFSLPPALPGAVGPDITLRQTWWILTIIATLCGLGLLGYGKSLLAAAGGIALIVVPHVIGAPQLDTYYGVAPPEVGARFVARSLGVACAVWVGMAAIAGWLWSRRETSAT